MALDDRPKLEDKHVLTLTTTLFANGLLLENTRRIEQGLLLTYSCQDEFGGRIRYLFVLASNPLNRTAVGVLQEIAQRESALPVIIGDAEGTDNIPAIALDHFLARFGGGITSLLPLEPYYRAHLLQLGNNELPSSLVGTPSDLFELHVAAGLQFLLGRRVVQYGSKRRGEACPDGVALRDGKYLLYDSKAARDGFSVEIDSVRQFADYVADFTTRYGTLLGQPHVFLVVSGSFANSQDGLESRSRELYAQSGVMMACLDAATLGEATALFAERPTMREIVDWKSLLVQPVIRTEHFKRVFARATKDRLMGGGRLGYFR